MRVPGRQELPLSVLAAQVLEEPAAQGTREGRYLLLVSSASVALKHSPPALASRLCTHPSSRGVPTHGSGSRLFALATKLKGMKPSWPVVRDCAFHHSPFLCDRASRWGLLGLGLGWKPSEPPLHPATHPLAQHLRASHFVLRAAAASPWSTAIRGGGGNPCSLPCSGRARMGGEEGALTAPGYGAVHPSRSPSLHRERARSCAEQ